MELILNSDSLERTEAIGHVLGRTLQKHPAVVLLTGDLGSGKTTLTKAIAAGMDLDDLVTSPTFTLMNIYGEGAVYHFDLYRLQDEDELSEIGFEEILEAQVPVLIEWPDLVKDYPFEHVLFLTLRYGSSPDQRVIHLLTEETILLEGLSAFE